MSTILTTTTSPVDDALLVHPNNSNEESQQRIIDNNGDNNNKDDSSCSESFLLKRHYSTIGIGDVFLEPPSQHSLPWNYLRHDIPVLDPHHQHDHPIILEDKSFLTWEIVGNIKSTPEDFVVREIAKPNRIIQGLSPEEMLAYQVADLPDLDQVNDITELGVASCDDPAVCAEPVVDYKSPVVPEHDIPASQTQQQQAVAVAVALEKQSLQREEAPKKQKQVNCEKPLETETANQLDHHHLSSPTDLSPRESVLKILEHVYPEPDGSLATINAASILSSLEQLEQDALTHIQQLSQQSGTNCAENHPTAETATVPSLRLPMITSTSFPTSSASIEDHTASSKRGGDRGEFHRAIRRAFPLLKSEVIHSHEEDSHIRISREDALDGIIPFLYQPQVDLLRLHRFRHRGYNVQDRHKATSSGNEGIPVALRLLPTLPRERRREVHFLLERACPELTRNTDPNYPLLLQDENTDSTEPSQQDQRTAAIILWWSRRTQEQAVRKRKRTSDSNASSLTAATATSDTATTTNSLPHTLCVMRKYHCEHLTAINRIKIAVRCTPSDIGLAGIKDTQAITYQFCTFRWVTPHRLAKANAQLSQYGIQLGNFFPVNWLLNQGELYGNRFHITVRGLKRIRVNFAKREGREGCSWEEQIVPCDRQHVMSMVHRIQTHGFINFYGDQRVGIPGQPDYVGVRSFDIGQAMLQRNFTKAIDLLVTGRVTCNESVATRKARAIWRISGGDAALTLKAMPLSVARERAVLQGLKRYGKDNPLAALKCLHFSVRQFWINAYQSYIWNAMATKRMELFGTHVVQGDLYYEGDELQHGEVLVVQDGMTDSVRLSQIVLPLPGYNIRYPENQVGEEYRKLLKEEGVVFDRDAPLEAMAKGDYRRLVALVENLSVAFDDGDGSDCVNSMKLAFDLKRGSYATSMLRELMLTTVGRDNVDATDNIEC